MGLFLSLLLSICALASVPMQTRQGVVIGRATANGEFFPNIPYARAPIGPLRWKAPRAPAPRTTAWDGSRLNIKCAQAASYFSGLTNGSEFGHPVGSEDCLYLNVWRPQGAASRRPVFVWFHGGSNRQGYASDPLYDGEKLAALTDSIVITVNYRLGVFGALSHEALTTSDRADSSGNYVTLDLIQSLTWIHENIEALGGDAEHVTIGGESAGCMNVWALIQSPLAKDLFTQAYCSSGFPNNYPVSMAHASAEDVIANALVLRKRATDLESAKKLLATMSARQTKNFLYSLSTEELLSLPQSFLPVQHIADGYVLPSAGLLALVSGSYNAVPMLVSSNEDEGSIFFLQQLSGITKGEFWSMLTGASSTAPLEKFAASSEVTRFQNQSATFTYAMTQLIDSILAYRQVRQGAIYRMRFEWSPSREPWHTLIGSSHGLDLPFLFQGARLDHHFFHFAEDELKDAAALRLSNEFLTYLKGFLHSGDPNAQAGSLPHWSPWNSVLPENLTFGRGALRAEYHYVNPIVGTVALANTIYDLQRATQEAAPAAH